jgi:hypothetical protein
VYSYFVREQSCQLPDLPWTKTTSDDGRVLSATRRKASRGEALVLCLCPNSVFGEISDGETGNISSASLPSHGNRLLLEAFRRRRRTRAVSFVNIAELAILREQTRVFVRFATKHYYKYYEQERKTICWHVLCLSARPKYYWSVKQETSSVE